MTSACLLTDIPTTWVNIIVTLCPQIGGSQVIDESWKHFQHTQVKGPARASLMQQILLWQTRECIQVHTWEYVQMNVQKQEKNQMTQYMEWFATTFVYF